MLADKRRKGQFTVANLAGVAVLLFLFAYTSDLWLGIIQEAAEGSGILLSAVLYSIPAMIFMGIFGAPFMLAQKRFEKRKSQERRV